MGILNDTLMDALQVIRSSLQPAYSETYDGMNI